jgi:hypothetical protein
VFSSGRDIALPAQLGDYKGAASILGYCPPAQLGDYKGATILEFTLLSGVITKSRTRQSNKSQYTIDSLPCYAAIVGRMEE